MEIIQNLVSKSPVKSPSERSLLRICKSQEAAFGSPSLGKHLTFVSWYDAHRTALLLSDGLSIVSEKSSTQDD